MSEATKTITFIHNPDDFIPTWVNKAEKSLIENYGQKAQMFGFNYEIIGARELIACVDYGTPSLMWGERNLLKEPRIFLLEQTSWDTRRDKHLRAIYEVVAASDCPMLNRATSASDFIERDKAAIVNHAHSLNIPTISSIVVPPYVFASNALVYLDELESDSWILKPREMAMGRAILKFDKKEELKSALEFVCQNENSFIIQPYIKHDGDLRVFVVNGKVVAALYRKPEKDNYLSNVSRGATPMLGEVSESLRIMCEKISRSLGGQYLCIDWLITKQGPILNEWCTALGGFTKAPIETIMFQEFFGFAKSLDKKEKPNPRATNSFVKQKHLESELDFVSISEKQIQDIVLIVGKDPKLMLEGKNLLEGFKRFFINRMSSSPAVKRYLQAIYQTILVSENALLNDSIINSEILEIDRFAMLAYASRMGIPTIRSYSIPPQENALKLLNQLDGTLHWIVEPREKSQIPSFKIELSQLPGILELISQTNNPYLIRPVLPDQRDIKVIVKNGECIDDVTSNVSLMSIKLAEKLMADNIVFNWVATSKSVYLVDWDLIISK